MMRKLNPTELAENQACEMIAEGLACTHSPASTDYDRGALHAAEAIAARIRQRRLNEKPKGSVTR